MIASWLVGAALAQVPPTLLGVPAGSEVGQHVPLDLRLIGADGRRTTLGAAMRDQPTALVLAWFRCPMRCAPIGEGLANARRPGEDPGWTALTLAFDPEDRWTDAARARARDGADWPYLVVADPTDRRLERALGFVAREDPSGTWAHPPVIYVLSADGRLAERIPGVNPDPVVLWRAVGDAGRGRLTAGSTWVEACFRWDPRLRTHGGQLLAVLRLGSGLGAVTVAMLVVRLVRKGPAPAERRRTASMARTACRADTSSPRWRVRGGG